MNKKVTWRTYFYRGKKEFELSNYKSALKSFKNALNKNTSNKNNNCLTSIYLASTYYFLKDVENAIYYVKIAFKKEYNFSHGQIRELVEDLRLKKLNKKKIKDLNNFLKIFESLIKKSWGHILIKNPTSYLIEIYWMRAILYRILGKIRWDLAFCSKAISLFKYKFEINKKKEYDWFENFDFCLLLRERALIYIRKRSYEKAIDDINNSLLIEKFPESYFLAGIIYRNLSNYNLSISMFSEAIKYPYNENYLLHAYINRGFCRIKNGNIEEAINDFKNALSINENCLKEYPNILKKIPEGIKNIIRIYLQIKV